jgi:hypothetical protein
MDLHMRNSGPFASSSIRAQQVSKFSNLDADMYCFVSISRCIYIIVQFRAKSLWVLK